MILMILIWICLIVMALVHILAFVLRMFVYYSKRDKEFRFKILWYGFHIKGSGVTMKSQIGFIK